MFPRLAAIPVYACIYARQTDSYTRSKYETSSVLSAKNRETFSRDLDFCWLSVNQWVFVVFGRRIRVPYTEMPKGNAHSKNSIFISF